MNILFYEIPLLKTVNNDIIADSIVRFNNANGSIVVNDSILEEYKLELEEEKNNFEIELSMIDNSNMSVYIDDVFIINYSGNGVIDGYLMTFKNIPEFGTAKLYHNGTLIQSVQSDSAGYFIFENINEMLIYNVEAYVYNSIFDAKVKYNLSPISGNKIPKLINLQVISPIKYPNQNFKYTHTFKIENFDSHIDVSMIPDLGMTITKNDNIYTLSGIPTIDSNNKFEYVIRIINRFDNKEDLVYDYTYSTYIFY